MLESELLSSLKGYNRKMFFNDLISGIIVAIIALPLSIALGISSGVSPEKGLITAIVGGFFVSMLGGSKVQIGGPTGAFIPIVLGIISSHGLDGLIIATFMAGIILICMGSFKLGGMVKFIPHPIIMGFTSGIAVTIFSTQIKDFLGLKITKVPGEFLEKWACYISNIQLLNIEALVIGILTIGIILLWPKFNKKIPSTLIAIIATTLIVKLFHLNVATIETQFGQINGSIPLPHVPHISLSTIKELFMPAIAIALLGSIESLLSAVVADGMIDEKHKSNTELIGQGFANIFSSLFGGIPVTGAIARTAANVKNGAKSPVSGIIHSVALLCMMLILMPYIKFIPMTSLAGILIIVSYNMGEWHNFKELSKYPKSDATIFILTFVLTVVFDLVIAIECGMILSSFIFMKKMADCTKCTYIAGDEGDSHYDSEIAIYKIKGPFFFGAVDKFLNVIESVQNPPKALILKMKDVPVIDESGYIALSTLLKKCKKHRTKLIITGIQKQPHKILQKHGFIAKVGEESICHKLEDAIKVANRYTVKYNYHEKTVS